jgi:predicted transglutaminase-like cysteine proteinase
LFTLISSHFAAQEAILNGSSEARPHDERGGVSGVQLRTGFVALFILLALAFQAQNVSAGALKGTFAAVGQETATPYGWLDFCDRQPQECDQPVQQAQDFALTPKAWHLLRAINSEVNASIMPVSNLEHWGTIADHWDYPTDGKGDCKIYALQKRRLLIEKGVPRQALLMTIVKDHHDMGHTILTVRTDKGDFILDNLTNDIFSWDATGYRFLKRQSQEDPNVWLSILLPDRARKISAR